ncbi:hypothetical protein K492DRAFT_177060 [Lichtheimia hyalospora FSU 10163]|nr:hypothetical protein K492DRAFT_177060 [Lichtheimia hyalospora FSU 10163]
MDGNATTSSHSWTIKTKDNTEIKRYEPPPPPATLSDPFEDRLKTFIHDPTTRTMVTELHARSVTELNRRHLERQARKSNGNITVPAQTRPKTPTEETPTTTTVVEEEQEPQQQQNHPYQFLDVSSLTSVDQKAWHTNIRKDTGINYPHRWLRLASLFSVQSKTLRQPSFLTPACERSALQDLESQPFVMDNYLKIRDIQNRNYAMEAVQEGIKEFEKKNLSTAMECYKRAMDMDGKYAEAYYRVAEVMLHENKRRQALERLEYALRLDPQHEGAKALRDTLVTRKRDERSRTESNASRHLPRSTSRHDDQPRQRSKDTHEKHRDDYRSRNGDEEDRESRGSSSHRTRRRRDDGLDDQEDDHKASNRHQRKSDKEEDRRSRRRREERMEQENGQRSSLGVSDHEEGRKSHRRRKRDEYEDTDRHGKRRHEQEDNDKSNTRHRHHDRSDERRQRKRRDDENRYRRQSRDRDYRRKRRHSPNRDRRSPRRRTSRSPRRRNNSPRKS